MNTDIYNKIIQDHKELSSLPQTLSEVLKVIQNENSSAGDLGKVIGHDPALTVKILRIVNSAYYAPKQPITTLTQAVMALGTRAVSALALSTSIYDMTGKWQTSLDRIKFWRHSLETAIASREIAKACRYQHSEEAFISGLLHDIGLLVLEKSFPDKFAYIWNQAESGEQLTELEENTWGTNHARVGQFLLEQWNIPAVISEAVGQHHNVFPPDAFDEDFKLSQIVLLANSISKFPIATINGINMMESENRTIVRSNLKLSEEKLHQIEKDLFQATVDEAQFLEIEIGTPEELLTEANRLLYHQYLSVEKLLEENNRMQKEIIRAKMEKASLESLKTITATFNHYLNNAAASILGRAQLVEVSLDKGEIVDKSGKLPHAMDIIINSVSSIQIVLEELKDLNAFKTSIYHDDTYILDIEKKIKAKLESMRKTISPSV